MQHFQFAGGPAMAETMHVETFECGEVSHEPTEASEEAIGIIEALGLQGQKTFVASRDGKMPARVPYRLMTAEEVAVYATLCPVAKCIRDYDSSPIPLRVLQIAAHAK